MDIAKEREELKKRQQGIVEQINQVASQMQNLEARRQELLQEALRLNGEVRLLERLSKDGNKPKPD